MNKKLLLASIALIGGLSSVSAIACQHQKLKIVLIMDRLAVQMRVWR